MSTFAQDEAARADSSIFLWFTLLQAELGIMPREIPRLKHVPIIQTLSTLTYLPIAVIQRNPHRHRVVRSLGQPKSCTYITCIRKWGQQ